jgi:hypothetical protein
MMFLFYSLLVGYRIPCNLLALPKCQNKGMLPIIAIKHHDDTKTLPNLQALIQQNP